MTQLRQLDRVELERQWRSWVVDGLHSGPRSVRREVSSSWERSAATVDWDLRAAPANVPTGAAAHWGGSRLGLASRAVLDDLRDLARTGDLIAAIADETVSIAWTAGGRTMTRRADAVRFAPGGCWDERAVGTNALCLARHSRRPAMVYSAEHYAPMVHDWVCYSAPIIDPGGGQFAGVVDISATWSKAHPALLTTVTALARCVEHELAAMGPTTSAPSPVVLRTLGRAGVVVAGQHVAVTHRQLELLAVLSLHPEGLGLDELTGRVYGDHPVSASTVKAELSHLRQLLDGRIGSRPYRLLGAVDADHAALLDALRAGDLQAAVRRYDGPLLAWSESPELVALRHQVDVALRDAVLRTGDGPLLYDLGGRCPADAGLHAAAVAALGDDDPRRSIAAGRLAAAR